MTIILILKNVEAHKRVYVKHVAHCLVTSLTSLIQQISSHNYEGLVYIDGEGQEGLPKSDDTEKRPTQDSSGS